MDEYFTRTCTKTSGSHSQYTCQNIFKDFLLRDGSGNSQGLLQPWVAFPREHKETLATGNWKSRNGNNYIGIDRL